jgi:hypothetical protein
MKRSIFFMGWERSLSAHPENIPAAPFCRQGQKRGTLFSRYCPLFKFVDSPQVFPAQCLPAISRQLGE